MHYLLDLHRLHDRWLGATPQDRARTQRYLSWHHTNTRQITLDYFLPVLLMPAYHGSAPPVSETAGQLRQGGRESLERLEVLLGPDRPFLGGQLPNIADFFIASDLFALDIDPGRKAWFTALPAVSAWLERLRETRGYAVSHGPWNAVVPRLRELVKAGDSTPRDCHWVADACLAAERRAEED